MMVDLVPASVAYVETRDDAVPAELFPGEEAFVSKAVDERRREFGTVRRCAREALSALGYPPAPILRGPRGAPTWPRGVVGSMTHCRGYRAAAVARASEIVALGVDAEPNEPVPRGVSEIVACPDELRQIAWLRDRDGSVCWDRLLFSAKEAVYKAWFPLAQRWLDFHEAEITIDPAGAFLAVLLVAGPALPGGKLLREFNGRWRVDGDLVGTAVVLPAPV